MEQAEQENIPFTFGEEDLAGLEITEDLQYCIEPQFDEDIKFEPPSLFDTDGKIIIYSRSGLNPFTIKDRIVRIFIFVGLTENQGPLVNQGMFVQVNESGLFMSIFPDVHLFHLKLNNIAISPSSWIQTYVRIWMPVCAVLKSKINALFDSYMEFYREPDFKRSILSGGVLTMDVSGLIDEAEAYDFKFAGTNYPLYGSSWKTKQGSVITVVFEHMGNCLVQSITDEDTEYYVIPTKELSEKGYFYMGRSENPGLRSSNTGRGWWSLYKYINQRKVKMTGLQMINKVMREPQNRILKKKPMENEIDGPVVERKLKVQKITKFFN